MSDVVASNGFRTSVTATLSVRNWARAVDFYKAAFDATELYRVPGGGVGSNARSGRPLTTSVTITIAVEGPPR